MTVDLNTCTGCSACVIACQAENNVARCRKFKSHTVARMHWIRIDRYFATEHASIRIKARCGGPGDGPRTDDGQHCENAPCETVCPVNATIHSEDGLNVMLNRCIARAIARIIVHSKSVALTTSIITSGQSAKRKSPAPSTSIRNTSPR